MVVRSPKRLELESLLAYADVAERNTRPPAIARRMPRIGRIDARSASDFTTAASRTVASICATQPSITPATTLRFKFLPACERAGYRNRTYRYHRQHTHPSSWKSGPLTCETTTVEPGIPLQHQFDPGRWRDMPISGLLPSFTSTAISFLCSTFQ
jgi:hypothetical protein